jgi:uncharacterized protein
MALLLFALVLLASILLIPLGLPGTWLMIVAGLGYNYLAPGDPVSMWALGGASVIALVGELLEFSLAGRYTKKYGGSSRAAWGAIAGGVIGAIVGVPIPIIGSVIGAFAGSFAGALVAELTRGTDGRGATRVATGALLGRVAAAAMKVGLGVVMAAWLLADAAM